LALGARLALGGLARGVVVGIAPGRIGAGDGAPARLLRSGGEGGGAQGRRARAEQQASPHHTRRKTSTALLPPKAKELLTAASRSGASTAPGRTRFSAQAASGASQCALGGSWRFASASTVITASSAPAAPSRWPCSALVELTFSRSKSSPHASARASRSIGSPILVAVPCALQ